MTARARVTLTKRVPAGQGVSYGHTYVTAAGDDAGAGAARLRRRGAPARLQRRPGAARRQAAGRSPAGSAWTRSCWTVGDDPVAAGDVATLFGPGDDGGPTADDWAEAVGTINYEIVTRFGGSRVPRSTTGQPAYPCSTSGDRGRRLGMSPRVPGGGPSRSASSVRPSVWPRPGWPPRSPSSGSLVRRSVNAPGDPYVDEAFGDQPFDSELTVTAADGTDLHVEIVEPSEPTPASRPSSSCTASPSTWAPSTSSARCSPSGASTGWSSTTSRGTAGPAG